MFYFYREIKAIQIDIFFFSLFLKKLSTSEIFNSSGKEAEFFLGKK